MFAEERRKDEQLERLRKQDLNFADDKYSLPGKFEEHASSGKFMYDVMQRVTDQVEVIDIEK